MGGGDERAIQVNFIEDGERIGHPIFERQRPPLLERIGHTGAPLFEQTSAVVARHRFFEKNVAKPWDRPRTPTYRSHPP